MPVAPPDNSAQLRLAVVCDPLDEGWASMNLAADMLFANLTAAGVSAGQIRPPIRRLARRVPRFGDRRAALNVDRLVGRYLDYPARLLFERSRFDAFHLVDHSYAQLLHALPAGRAGVFCHDLDTFLCLLEPERDPRPAWFRALTRVTFTGLQKAAVVFHTTNVVREHILRHRVVDPERLIQAPYGVAPEFHPGPPEPLPEELATRLGGRPFVLHVGNALARKRLDVLFEVFARLRARLPELMLVQKGAVLEPKHREQLQRLKIEDAVVQPRVDPAKLASSADRASVAALYRSAELLLFPSESEGFGLPVIEALASGCRVVASDIPVLREVGGDAVTFCPLGDVEAWTEAVSALLPSRDRGPSAETRARRAELYTWRRHAEIIRAGYARWVR